jgi:hypothetical protein
MMVAWWSAMFPPALDPANAWLSSAGFGPFLANGYSRGIYMQAVKGLFGGGADKSARQEAEKSRQTQRVANDRQLSEANRNSQAIGASRRAPRGRRLFEDGPDNASAVLG